MKPKFLLPIEIFFILMTVNSSRISFVKVKCFPRFFDCEYFFSSFERKLLFMTSCEDSPSVKISFLSSILFISITSIVFENDLGSRSRLIVSETTSKLLSNIMALSIV